MWLRLKNLSSLAFFLLLFNSRGQPNLVPNWSFESISQCPHYFSPQPTILFAIPWQNPNIGTSDLFSSCDTIVNSGFNAPGCGVPNNVGGNQPARTGSNYAGFLAWGKNGSQNNIREYIQIYLSDSLKVNETYCLSFFVSLSDTQSQYATSRLGGYFSNIQIGSSTQYLLSTTPQVLNPLGNFLSNYNNWTAIQGLYSAVGGEKYLTIGNFFDDNSTDTMQVFQPNNLNTGKSYYYIDDIGVVKYSGAAVGSDTVICQGINIKRGAIPSFGADYNWSILSGDLNSIDSVQIASPTLSPSITTVYVLQKQQCGIYSYDTLIVHVPQNYPAIASTDTSICIGDTINLIAQNNCSWCTHSWNGGNTALQIPVSPETATIYSFTQVDSCFTTTDQVMVNVEYCYSPIVSVPNIFTPNGDDINEIWMPIIQNESSVGNYSVEIYNRWGIQVFQTENIREGWDGHTTSGIECMEGTYYYLINYTDIKEGTQKKLKGFLQLSR